VSGPYALPHAVPWHLCREATSRAVAALTIGVAPTSLSRGTCEQTKIRVANANSVKEAEYAGSGPANNRASSRYRACNDALPEFLEQIRAPAYGLYFERGSPRRWCGARLAEQNPNCSHAEIVSRRSSWETISADLQQVRVLCPAIC
jgi:hypothetical protein